MHLTKIPLGDTKSFSTFFLDYINQKESLKPFYEHFPTPENFNKALTKKSGFPQSSRDVLVKTLERQYASLTVSEAVKKNIEAFSKPTTFSITTGHQLNIFTGPLYFIYKIVTVVNACRELNKRFPQHHFVPVYWMASEDHDYDEIKSFRLYGKKYVWQTNQTGAVGRFKTSGFKELLDSLPGNTDIFRDAYLKNKTLAEAVRSYVNQLFGAEGLVVLDADDRDLKAVFKPVIREDVLHGATLGLVEKTNKALESLGYETQIFCRDINFFYLDEGIRSRIEKKDDRYRVLDTNLEFSETEIAELIETAPQKFSPNVILRPLYQEFILPNVAYVGGPAEVIYWLQLKSVFDHFQTPFPILMPRNFAMVIDHTVKRKMDKTGLDLKIFFEPKNFINNHWVLQNTKHDLTVGAERTLLKDLYEKLRQRAEGIDKTLGPFVGAEESRLLNSLEKIEKRLLRAEKRIHADRLRQIEEVKNALFPGDALQERVDNFLNFYQPDPNFIRRLIDTFDPFDYQFNILMYSDEKG